MIDFVAYFSTAQDELGYIVLDGYGTSAAEFIGGPSIAEGVYRVEDGNLVMVEDSHKGASARS